ncbi:TraR/DksA C4-type zinc finger protein [Streptomyces sp. DSM 41972]|uniref:TraR/DksA C4-type zinc finger protein n=1 Tax=Streptomyces althioticus subsp. attaecolombicae TaxID=3075534 RepID=A0ABU3HVJ4_9ACTN|nr:TraR/DksA C4-type zinc finger protein [Streptomyces sp. DSM 41972]SCE00321.1 transcriptional regulator, TraR/DksA family [Streptomyces sp. di188]SCE07065.1 transcriptional regulator, TraR/DksA family [Streptomyces sp. di50b]
MVAKKATGAETHAGGRGSAVSDAAGGGGAAATSGARTRKATAKAADAATGTEAAAGRSAGAKAVAAKKAGTPGKSTTTVRKTGRAAAKRTAGKGPEREEAAAGAGGADTDALGCAPEGNGAARTSGSAQDGAGHSAADDADAAEAAAQTGVTTVGAKKTPGPAATAAATAVPKARHGAVEPGELAVRPGEEPWTGEEVEEARAELMSEVLRLREEISSSERSLAGLMRDSGDGAGDDDADTGTKNITREHELALAANAREMLDQFERALQRLDAGTYGLCENCGKPIGKARMQAFPRATLCVECKQKQERRY